MTQGNHIVFHSVDKPPTVRITLKGVSHRVDDLAWLNPSLWDLPHFLDTNHITIRIFPFIQIESINESLSKASP
ncbi:hypothetical protein ES703_95623 [subsurface metagenome]